MTNRTAIYAGTFDPITNGHMDIIQRALHVVDRLIIGVAEDTGKSPIFSINERIQLVKREVLSLGDDVNRVEVNGFSGLLVEFAADNEAKLLVRGLRAVSDFEYEFQMACMNSKLAPDTETIFLTASESTHFVSSRFVKQISRLGGDVSQLVSSNVEDTLNQHYSS